MSQTTPSADAYAGAINEPAAEQVLFETTLAKALAAGGTDMMPVWSHLLNAVFFVAVIKRENGPINDAYDYAVFNSTSQAEPYILISEYPQRMNNPLTQELIRVRGGSLLHSLNPKHAIMIALSQNGFNVPTDLLAWLRANTQFQTPDEQN